MNITIRKIESAETNLFIQLLKVFEDVFEMKDFSVPPQHHLEHLLHQDGFYVFIALNNLNEVVGGLTAYTLNQYYSLKPLVYIYDLAVKTDLQRTGIGTKLIAAIKKFCSEKGVEEVFVQADRIDHHALNFYRKTGATEEDVVHFNYPLV